MPKCKYCGERITKFDKDICPYCGEKNPIDDNQPMTVDITQVINTIDKSDEVLKQYKNKNKIINALLCMFLGFFGIDLLYLGFKKRCIARIIVNVVLYVAMMLVFYFTAPDKTNAFFIFALPIIIVFALWFIVGLIFLLLNNKKDANGVFLK